MMSKKLKLSNYTQGVRGGPGSSRLCGYSLTTMLENDKVKMRISVDLFEGHGPTYKERDEAWIGISFTDEVTNISWEGTVEKLKQMILKSGNNEKI